MSEHQQSFTEDPNYKIWDIQSVAGIDRPELKSLWSFWQGRRSGDLLPSRSDFLIEEFLPWGRNISMMEYRGEPREYRVTLASIAMIDLNGVDPTGKTPREYVPAQAYDFAVINLQRSAAGKCSVHDRYSRHNAGKPVACDRLTLPCASDGKAIDYFLIAHYFDRGFLGRLSDLTIFDRVADS
tara:strand:- start:4034 stop:4582 length:549 start_codon:yes stop_codon:yes gene_type:complete